MNLDKKEDAAKPFKPKKRRARMRARKAKAKALAEGKSELPAQGLKEEEKAELGTKRKLYETNEEIDGMLDSENGLFCGMEVMNMSEYQVSGGEPVTVTLKEPKDEEEPKKKKKKKATPRATPPTAEREKEISSEDASEISKSWSLHCGVSLHPVLCRGLASLKYPTPTPIQSHCLAPAILGRRDVIGAAPTGSGKTLAFSLPVLQGLLESEGEGVRGLILTPTRELAMQIRKECDCVCLGAIKIGLIVGGFSEHKQKRVLESGCQVIVGTVGRLWDLMSTEEYPALNNLSKTLKYLVIDEVDRMMTSTTYKISYPQLTQILEQIKTAPTQTFVFSATLALHSSTTINSILDDLSSTNPRKTIDLTSSSPSARLPPGLKLSALNCTQMHKDSHCYALLTTLLNPVLLFCNSIAGARRVSKTLSLLLPGRASLLHGDMTQKARAKRLEELRRGDTIVLVATDVAARGIDVPNVKSVLHYDVPRSLETFVHRSGRCARGIAESARGVSVSLVAPQEEKAMRPIVDSFEFDPFGLDGFVFAEAQRRTAMATRIHLLEEEERKSREEDDWFTKAAEEADIDLDENTLGEMALSRKGGRAREIEKEKKKLQALLGVPLRKHKFGKFLEHGAAERALREEKDAREFVVLPKEKRKKKKKPV